MTIIGLEEHFVTEAVLKAWRALDSEWQDLALTRRRRAELDTCLSTSDPSASQP